MKKQVGKGCVLGLVALFVLLGANGAAMGEEGVHGESKGNKVVLENGTTKKADKIPLCVELHEIMKRPENAKFFDFTEDATPLYFPPEYKQFKEVEWTPVSREEAEKIVGKEVLQKKLNDAMKHAALNKWSEKGEFVFKKTRVDFDGMGTMVTMLSYRLSSWSPYRSLIGLDAPPKYYKRETINDHAFSCFSTLITYGGRFYWLTKDSGNLSIQKPRPLLSELITDKEEWRKKVDLYNEGICQMRRIR